ncbi:MAG: hypothetical protein E6X19_00050 [Hungatella hathewayi]|uniref:hypothetical protein n=1 Tax=Hungatella sp. TaxID=2613924 RepID=UPI00290904C8|nr:hypothetical protein [Hungatella hathewayi]
MYSTTPQRKTLEKLCPYCGKTRTYTYRDGYDEVDYGTGRSRYIPSSTVDEGCDCMLGKLSHVAEKIQIKKQCANCAWNVNGNCTNKQERTDVSEMFGITGDLVIKNESKRCKHYELSKNIFDALIELKN